MEREIAEILERAESTRTPVESFQSAVRQRRAAAESRLARPPKIGWPQLWSSPAIVRMVSSLLLAAAAAMIADASRLLALVLAIASALALFSLWVPAGGSSFGKGSTRWRGRDLRDGGPTIGHGPGASPTRPWRGPRRPSR